MERFNESSRELGKCIVALIATCEVLGIDYPQKLKPMNVAVYVQLANKVAGELGIPMRANNTLETLGKTVQSIIDASVYQGKASISDIEQVYNKKLDDLL